MAKSAEARKVLRDLDKELEASGQQQGHTLVWSAQERGVIGLISAQIDWKCELWRRTRRPPTRRYGASSLLRHGFWRRALPGC